ncbi:hypothetical protein [Clostridium minihomine]|uniref:hypothetical protein n=1 Tax=Clostridium minihomine TaxID=2045012 RepID=UPI000C7700A0|nr:hypothetical protein [Clostridium minihomine]
MTVNDLSPRDIELLEYMNLARDNHYEIGLAGEVLKQFPNFTINSTPEEISEMIDQEINSAASKTGYDPADPHLLQYKEFLLIIYKHVLSGYFKGLLHYHFTQDELDEMRMLCKQDTEQIGA